MRLWSVHPKYLDVKGLTAVWREGLLAQAVLRGRTRGYKNHPQLVRFRGHGRPLAAINCYLWHVWIEAGARGYSFDARKVRRPGDVGMIVVTRGQVEYEWGHLLGKLKVRDRGRWESCCEEKAWAVHPLMEVREGAVEGRERVDQKQ